MNHRNPAIKRILADVKELQRHPSSRYHAQPLEENMFEWHFTIRGPEDTPFAGGMYHGRILLPAEYPFKPPNIVFLTKNGRFEVGTKICLSISAYHEETWQPAWGIRTMLEALISFLPTEGAGAIGALDWTPEERRRLAVQSRSYVCPTCGAIADLLSEPTTGESEFKPDKEIQDQVAQLHMGAPTRSDSSRHDFSNAGNDLLFARALNASASPGDGGDAFDGIEDSSPMMETSAPGELKLPALDESLGNTMEQSPIEFDEDVIELSEDAVDNFEVMQEIEQLPSSKAKAEAAPQIPSETLRRDTNSSIGAERIRENNNRIPRVHHAPPQPALQAEEPIDRLRRIEDFLNTVIIITIVGILAILLRVFLRNVLHLDF